MPVVQRVEGPSVAPEGIPNARVTANLSPDYANRLERGVRDVGVVVQGIAQREQEKAETAQVLEARRKLSDWERGWFDPNNAEGVYAAKGRDALGLVDKIDPEFERVQSEIMGSLRSPKAQQAFMQYAAGQRESVLDRVNQYAVREHDGYVQAEFKANVLNSTEMAARAAAEDRTKDRDREIQNGLAVIRAQAVTEGAPAEATQLQERAFLSAVHATAINTKMAQGDIPGAFAYLNAHAAEIDVESAAKLQAQMAPQLDAMTARSLYDGMQTGRVTPQALGMDVPAEGLWAAQLHQESPTGQYGKDGRLVRSPVGAVGGAQIMPTTGPVAAKYAGLPWDEKLFLYDGPDPDMRQKATEYNLALGKAYQGAQTSAFGSPILGMAAYNAGPGAVQAWLQPAGTKTRVGRNIVTGIGDPRKGEISMADFVAAIPYKETRNYVTSIMKRAGGSLQAQAVAATTLEGQMEIAKTIVNPRVRDEFEQLAIRANSIRKAAEAEREQATRKSISTTIETMDPGVDLSKALPPDQFAYLNQNPEFKRSMTATLQARAAGQDEVSSPTTLAAINRIIYNATQNVGASRKYLADLDVYTLDLSPADRNRVAGNIAAVLKPSGANSTKVVNFQTDAQLAERTRARLGIAKGKNGDADYGKIEMQYADVVRAQSRQMGRELNAEEKQQIMDRLSTTFVREKFWGASHDDVPVYKATADDVENVPDADRKAITELFRRAGNPNPTPTQFMLLYQQWQDRKTARASGGGAPAGGGR